ncbi:hypothetical protein [Nostoc sp. UHCC 0251]|uniref:hypothetical protein n=1 Tax=Nostoc sp. UHCC 0251 TaxID=3110240 RepID=UPI002B200619|nr:hypothetical protein [Nostoc sp. UHCC 0251]MEA5628233.1 hypothetical protein [Nostoc sp. UHCC 0251]
MCNQIVCLPKMLPRNQWVAAAQIAAKINPVNHPPIERLMLVMPGFIPEPEMGKEKIFGWAHQAVLALPKCLRVGEMKSSIL